MSKEFSAYKELVLDEDEEGGTWIARIYNRKGEVRMLATKSGSAENYEAARDAAVKWADAELEKYRITPLKAVSSTDEVQPLGIVGKVRKSI